MSGVAHFEDLHRLIQMLHDHRVKYRDTVAYDDRSAYYDESLTVVGYNGDNEEAAV